MKDVINYINSLNITDEYVIVACSGGPDSMMLLNLLNSMNIKCVCAHVNHNVREESKEEYNFLNKYCNDNDIIFEGAMIEKYKNDKFSEEEARDFRYKFFKKLIDKYHAKYLFTAHHGDDLMETILMRLVRGSSIYGYTGFVMETERDGYTIIRPLVYLDKSFIENYNNENNIPFCIDKTNYEDIHTRNRFRHHILPPIKNEDKDAHLKFLRYSNKLNELIKYVDRNIMKYYKDVFDDKYIDIEKFNKLDYYEKILIVEKVLDINYPDNLYLINDTHTNLILKLIESENNSELSLPNNIIIRKEYNKIYVINNIEVISYSYEFKDVIDLELGKIVQVTESSSTGNDVIRLNSKDIKLPLIVRSRNNGDKIHVKNLNGNKKVNDIFIDNKINKELRDKWPIVCDSDSKILWIPNLKKSNLDIPKDLSYDIILKYVTKEEKLHE